jgi:hypothetical protein
MGSRLRGNDVILVAGEDDVPGQTKK